MSTVGPIQVSTGHVPPSKSTPTGSQQTGSYRPNQPATLTGPPSSSTAKAGEGKITKVPGQVSSCTSCCSSLFRPRGMPRHGQVEASPGSG